jgi:hypothetical protein
MFHYCGTHSSSITTKNGPAHPIINRPKRGTDNKDCTPSAVSCPSIQQNMYTTGYQKKNIWFLIPEPCSSSLPLVQHPAYPIYSPWKAFLSHIPAIFSLCSPSTIIVCYTCCVAHDAVPSCTLWCMMNFYYLSMTNRGRIVEHHDWLSIRQAASWKTDLRHHTLCLCLCRSKTLAFGTFMSRVRQAGRAWQIISGQWWFSSALAKARWLVLIMKPSFRWKFFLLSYVRRVCAFLYVCLCVRAFMLLCCHERWCGW